MPLSRNARLHLHSTPERLDNAASVYELGLGGCEGFQGGVECLQGWVRGWVGEEKGQVGIEDELDVADNLLSQRNQREVVWYISYCTHISGVPLLLRNRDPLLRPLHQSLSSLRFRLDQPANQFLKYGLDIANISQDLLDRPTMQSGADLDCDVFLEEGREGWRFLRGVLTHDLLKEFQEAVGANGRHRGQCEGDVVLSDQKISLMLGTRRTTAFNVPNHPK